MTLKQLVLIVSEAVERAIILSRLKVTAFAFDKANTDKTLETARIVNGTAHELNPQSNDGGDVLFLDCIPLEYLPKLALGIGDEPICRQILAMVAQGKTILVLGKSKDDLSNAPAACIELIGVYRRFLKFCGYVFLDSDGAFVNTRTAQCHFNGSVLSRGDLLSRANVDIKEIIVKPDCVITTLAADTARSMNITVRKQIL